MHCVCVCVSQAIGATFAAMIGAGMLVRSISYEHSPIPKHLAWMLHAGNNAVVMEYNYSTITGRIWVKRVIWGHSGSLKVTRGVKGKKENLYFL